LRLKDAPSKILVLFLHHLNISTKIIRIKGICIIHPVQTSKEYDLIYQGSIIEKNDLKNSIQILYEYYNIN
jgi:hypothetical protein